MPTPNLEPHDQAGSVKFIARRVLPSLNPPNQSQILGSPDFSHRFTNKPGVPLPQGKPPGPVDSIHHAYQAQSGNSLARQDTRCMDTTARVSNMLREPAQNLTYIPPTPERTRSSRPTYNSGHISKTSVRRPRNNRTPANALKKAIGAATKTGSRTDPQTLARKLREHDEPKSKPQAHGFPNRKFEDSMDLSDISADESDSSLSVAPELVDRREDPAGEVEVLLQPQTRPITLDQLVIEVRTIYEVVVQFEDKAIRMDEEQTIAARVEPSRRVKMTKDEYMSYIALHKALLHEHHDLCLASQHPAASDSLRQLPGRYSIPARMWRHGVHAPLEVLRMRLPESREHMVAFILISFNHMTLFLETVPQFEATWLECIGDLGRYRLALAETDEEREMFSGIARDWYSRAIQLNPQISRLYHHCAILAPSFSLEQLSLYGRALTGIIPFLPARKSISALFRPVLLDEEQLTKQISRPTMAILRAHASLALGGCGSREKYNHCLAEIRDSSFLQLFSDATEQGHDAKKLGAHLAIAESASMLQYGVTRANGSSTSILRLWLGVSSHGNTDFEGAVIGSSSSLTGIESLSAREMASAQITVKASCTLAFEMFSIALKQPKNEDLHPFIHIIFVLVLSLTNASRAIQEIESTVPWDDMADFLNVYSNAASMSLEICSSEFPINAGGYSQTLPEDHQLQGLIFAKDYLPEEWMESSNPDLTEQAMELEGMTAVRLQRVLWAGHKIAGFQKWLLFEDLSREFSAGSAMDGLTMGEDPSDFVPLLPEHGF